MKIQLKNKFAPYITEDILSNINKRDELYKKFTETNDSNIYVEF